MADEASDFQWDVGNWPKCGKHGVSKAEIEHMLSHGALVLPDRTDGLTEVRFNAVGRNDTDRFVFVVFTFRTVDGARRIRPISARYMHQSEADHYERQRKAQTLPRVQD